MNKQTFYKVLGTDNTPTGGQGFDYTPYLPTRNDDGSYTPGEWLPPVKGKLAACANGWHVTLAPAAWWKCEGAKCYEIEHNGEVTELHDGEKIACRSMRLLREVTDHAELATLNVFLSGSHTVRSGFALALGSSRVEAWGSSHVVARGSSSVEAWGSSHVVALESSRVVARGSSRVVAWGSSHVVARESSRVVARESSSVEAWGSSHVEALESSRVEARGSSRVVAWGSSHVVARESSHVVAWESSRVVAWESSSVVARGSSSVVARGSSSVVARGSSHVVTPGTYNWDAPTVQVAEYAVWVDRKTGKPRIHACAASGAELVLVESSETVK